MRVILISILIEKTICSVVKIRITKKYFDSFMSKVLHCVLKFAITIS